MKIINYIVFFILALYFIVSCTSHEVDYKDLIKYLSDPTHGLQKEQKIGNITVRVTYRPQSLLIRQELNNIPQIKGDTLARLSEHYKGQLYFTLSFTSKNKDLLNEVSPDQSQFADLLNQLAFRMSEKVFLTTSEQDTLDFLDYAYPRDFGINNSTNLIFAFKNKNLRNTSWIEFKLLDIGLNIPPVRFRFYIKDINNIPQLIISKK
jgi:hypothetical protein